MLKAGGIWVGPVQVEAALIAHPAVLEYGVIGMQDKDELVKQDIRRAQTRFRALTGIGRGAARL